MSDQRGRALLLVAERAAVMSASAAIGLFDRLHAAGASTSEDEGALRTALKLAAPIIRKWGAPKSQDECMRVVASRAIAKLVELEAAGLN